jgi:hypothetical protein
MPARAQKPKSDAAALSASAAPILSDEPGGALALSFTQSAPSGSDQGQEKAASIFRTLIEPIISPERHGDFHRDYPKRTDRVRHIARLHNTSVRRLYRLLHRYQLPCEQGGGINALAPKIRSDAGRSRRLNAASQEFILAAILPGRGYGEYSAREAFRAYEEERLWRERHVSKLLSERDREASRLGSKLVAGVSRRPRTRVPTAVSNHQAVCGPAI